MDEKQHIIQMILNFLNLKSDSSFSYAKKILQKSMVCRYLLSFSNSDKKFSLLTREEAAETKDYRDSSRLSLNRLRLAMAPVDENITHTLLTGIMAVKEDILFPEDVDAATGMRGRDLFMRELFNSVEWFQNFMAGCEAGRMDIGLLNEFKYTKGVIMAFKPSKNPMNPALSADELLDTGDDIIERKLLCNFIYPFLFSGQGSGLSKVRRCRHCGTFFFGKRISATFCGSKCRGAFYYEKSIR